jgi:hypothetical protein
VSIHTYRETGRLESLIGDVWERRDRNVILAKVICVALTFAGYHLYAGIDRRLGDGTLWRTLRSRGHSTPAPIEHTPGRGGRAAARPK